MLAGLIMGPAGAFITGSDSLIDGSATASYYGGPLQSKAQAQDKADLILVQGAQRRPLNRARQPS